MKLLEIVTMMNIKASMVYKFFDKKTGSEISVNEELAEELHKPVIKNFNKEKYMRDLKTIFGQQIQVKWNHCPQRIRTLNINCVIHIFTKYS